MTFMEAYNTGLRFLRKDWNTKTYWQKSEENKITGVYDGLDTVINEALSQIYMNNSDNNWFIHPDDQYKLDFNNEWNKLIKEEICTIED